MTNRKTSRKEARPTVCVGCGGAAAGYNYEAPSCNSCKTFFRRTIVRKHVYTVCLKNGRCAEDAAFFPCRRCRYERLLKGKMNPKLITNQKTADANPAAELPTPPLSDPDQPSTSTSDSSPQDQEVVNNESSSRDHSIKEVLKPILVGDSPPEAEGTVCVPSRSSESETRITPNPTQFESKLERIMLMLLTLEEAHYQLRISTYSPRLRAGLTFDELADGPSKLGLKFDKMFTLQAYDPVSVRLVPEEVFIKHKVIVDFCDFDYTNKKLWVFQDTVYAIELMKALPVFSLLGESSQKIWLASAIICANFTTAFFSYSNHSDRSCYPDGGTMTWNRELQEESPDSTRFHTGLIAAMREAQLDKREYTLLKMIIICNPLLHGLTTHDSTLLQHEKERFTKTLLSYVFAKSGVEEGPARFAKLLSVLDLAQRLTTWQKNQHILMLAMGLHKHPLPFAVTIFHSH